MKRPAWKLAWRALSSLELTVACLGALMALVAACTVAQTRLGTFEAVDLYIRGPLVWGRLPGLGRSVPVFPGGGLVGAVLLVNLVAAHLERLELSWRKAGLWVVHFGLILLFIGEFETAFLAVESHMDIPVGATRGYAESFRKVELAIIDASAPDHDDVVSVPESVVSRRERIEDPRLPFTLLIKRYYPNAALEPRAASAPPPMATSGPGTRFSVRELPPVRADDQADQATAYVEALAGDRSLGCWLLSTAVEAPQSFTLDGRTWRLAIRPRRYYLPFSLTLKNFTHEIYPGTDVPRNFASLVRLDDPARGEGRDVKIYMNHPLRYGGKTFYQASFGQGDRLSVLQVVENPGWLLPYVACALVAFGLATHFLARLRPLEAAR